jgi:hypothetical protein
VPITASSKCAQETVDVREVVVEVEDGVAHDLPRPVVGDVAAAIDGEELHALLAHLGFVQQQVALLAALAQGVHVRVLAEEQVVLSKDLRTSSGAFRLAIFRSMVSLKRRVCNSHAVA